MKKAAALTWYLTLTICLTLMLAACGKTSVPALREKSGTEDDSYMEKSTQKELSQKPDDETKNYLGENPTDLYTYKNILDLYYQALYEHQTCPEQWQPDKFSAENGLVSSIINPYWSWEDANDILSKVGFAFLDLNEDGMDELVIGWGGNEFWNMDEGYVFAVYTLVDGEAVLALEGWERNKYVIGDEGYLYLNGSNSSTETTYIKYKFHLEYDGFLKPLEELYSQGHDNDYWWEHISSPADIGVIEYTEKHEDLWIDESEAQAITDNWMESGISIDYTLFSEYLFLE